MKTVMVLDLQNKQYVKASEEDGKEFLDLVEAKNLDCIVHHLAKQGKKIRIHCQGCGKFIWLDGNNHSAIVSAVVETEDGEMVLCSKCRCQRAQSKRN